MTIKASIDYRCPQCGGEWLPYEPGLKCPHCGREVPAGEVTRIVDEALESARFNMRLYGKFDVEYWIAHRLGDRYFQWGFKALQIAFNDKEVSARNAAVAALMELDLEEMAPYREHILGFLERLVERYREAASRAPADWQKMPEPEKPFFGRKIIEDSASG